MTRHVVIPPLFDPSLEPLLDPTDEPLDLNREFTSRITGAGHLRSLAAAYDLGQLDGNDPAGRRTKALFLRAAVAITARTDRHDAARLRAMGVAMRLSGENDPALRLAADDVEIVDGTTERGADVVSAAARTALFGAEADRARDHAPGQRVHLLVETDQQLPAAAALMEVLGAERVVLCGRFVRAHRTALAALHPFSAATGFDDWVPSWRLRKEWTTDGTPVHWVRRASDWRPGSVWAGWLEPDQAALLPTQAWRGCRGAALTVARLKSWSAVTSADGTRTDLEPVVELADEASLAVELLVGAPGVGADETRATAKRLASGPGPRLAGLSPFRLRAADCHDVPDSWDGLPLTRAVTGHDLARWDRFSAPDTLGETDRDAVLGALNAEFAAETDLYPGRFACCVLAHTAPAPVWEPSAAVVADEGEGPDGQGPGSFVVNLRTGSAFRLHPRLAPVVERLASGDATVLDRLSDTTRTKLSGQLVRAGVMRRAQ
ncbi:hypothetical protein ACWDG1_35745 [Streptomyces sp. NPDC001177]